jgi:histidinol dehydrogenase
MLTTIYWNKKSAKERSQLLQRAEQKNEKIFREKVQAMIDAVRLNGDSACRKMTADYDGVTLKQFAVTPQEFSHAKKQVNAASYQAMQQVSQQLYAYHVPQKLADYGIETAPGVLCEHKSRPIARVGLYIPGGSAPLVSTVFMLGVPANIAGCPIRILCSPPEANGEINPHILVAAELMQIKQVYKIGGAQAIAAMAYGTESIPKVDKIFGPGNPWVTQAKMLVAQDAAGARYDMPAGPSEVMVVADHTGQAEFIAADLLSQAEHGNDSQAILLSTQEELIIDVARAIERQMATLSRRDIIAQSLLHCRLILIEDLTQGLDIINDYAPEHLILQIANPRNYLEKIHCAGSIFLGPWSPEAAGDYASGTNHVLPTYGFARTLSGLSVRDFMKTISIQELSRTGLMHLSDSILTLSQIEGLEAHGQAVAIRVQDNQDA